MTSQPAKGNDILERMRAVVLGSMLGVRWAQRVQPTDISDAAARPIATQEDFVSTARVVRALERSTEYEQCRAELARCLLAGRHLSDADVQRVGIQDTDNPSIYAASIHYLVRGLVAARRGSLALQFARALKAQQAADVHRSIAAAAALVADEPTLREATLMPGEHAAALGAAVAALRAAVVHGGNPDWTLRIFNIAGAHADAVGRAYLATMVAQADMDEPEFALAHWRKLATHRTEDAVAGAVEMLLRGWAAETVAELAEAARFSVDQLNHLIERAADINGSSRAQFVDCLRSLRERCALSGSVSAADDDVLIMP